MPRGFLCCFARQGACDSSIIDDPSKQQQQQQELNAGGARAGGAGKQQQQESAVLVEMFTSQGCSSCPAADLMMSQLGQQGRAGDVPIVVLAFHVEFWDYRGWKDPFASSQWTLRQRSYGQALQQDSIYTPEVVVQGRAHCMASSGMDPVCALIRSAPRFPAPEINASFKVEEAEEGELLLQVKLDMSLKHLKLEDQDVEVVLAAFENGLVTNCEKGENKGRILTNDFVVRSLARAQCAVQSKRALLRSAVSIRVWHGFCKSSCGVALFIQSPSTMRAYGAQLLSLPADLHFPAC